MISGRMYSSEGESQEVSKELHVATSAQKETQQASQREQWERLPAATLLPAVTFNKDSGTRG